jgi:hypothetical protein
MGMITAGLLQEEAYEILAQALCLKSAYKILE